MSLVDDDESPQLGDLEIELKDPVKDEAFKALYEKCKKLPNKFIKKKSKGLVTQKIRETPLGFGSSTRQVKN